MKETTEGWKEVKQRLAIHKASFSDSIILLLLWFLLSQEARAERTSS